ncbi:hypothetical protein HanRHA438_Chr14g0642211 [Helianthus annuus]|nr:hypothetical protein HanRHA438_Chr14g0642211 [Helianthus annuus]
MTFHSFYVNNNVKDNVLCDAFMKPIFLNKNLMIKVSFYKPLDIIFSKFSLLDFEDEIS